MNRVIQKIADNIVVPIFTDFTNYLGGTIICSLTFGTMGAGIGSFLPSENRKIIIKESVIFGAAVGGLVHPIGIIIHPPMYIAYQWFKK